MVALTIKTGTKMIEIITLDNLIKTIFGVQVV